MFFLKDCLEYYRPDEYQLIDGEHVVRAVSKVSSTPQANNYD